VAGGGECFSQSASPLPSSASLASGVGSSQAGSASIGSLEYSAGGGSQSLPLQQVRQVPVPVEQRPVDQALDYPAIRALLAQPIPAPQQREVALLLQALRHLLTAAPSGVARRTILATYISHDLLSLRQAGAQGDVRHALQAAFQPAAAKEAGPVTEQLARLLNVMASDCMGRDYLLLPPPPGAESGQGEEQAQDQRPAVHRTIQLLDARMRGEGEESLLRQNLLGTLQKLSLRRSAQSTLNALGTVPYLYGLLGDAENLSDYTLEYGSALLMNLCLRTWGKRQSAVDPVLALKVLTDLVEHDSLQVWWWWWWWGVRSMVARAT
jgi:hypothetical protein